VAEGLTVSAISTRPTEAWACYVLAHGAGAGMTHPFLEAVASELGDQGIASLRYNFPFVERRSKRPDPPALAHATVRAAVMNAREIAPELPLVAGGSPSEAA
jgi:predicted alpha/beta-hydrolase family hydrolase